MKSIASRRSNARSVAALVLMLAACVAPIFLAIYLGAQTNTPDWICLLVGITSLPIQIAVAAHSGKQSPRTQSR
jgi:hypothetical protein